MAWLSCLIAAALAVIALVLGAFVLINGFAERTTSSVVGLIGTRGIGLVLGVPMILFAAWGLFRIIQGKSAPNMTPRQLLIALVSIILIGALGAGALIYAIAGDDAPKPSVF